MPSAEVRAAIETLLAGAPMPYIPTENVYAGDMPESWVTVDFQTSELERIGLGKHAGHMDRGDLDVMIATPSGGGTLVAESVTAQLVVLCHEAQQNGVRFVVTGMGEGFRDDAGRYYMTSLPLRYERFTVM